MSLVCFRTVPKATYDGSVPITLAKKHWEDGGLDTSYGNSFATGSDIWS